MRPVRSTRPSTLVLIVLVIGIASYVVFRTWYGDIPPLPWAPCGTIALIAAAEGLTARATKRRIDRKPGTEPMDPLVAARLVALAKASAILGAALVGAWGGGLAYSLMQLDRISAATRDAEVSGTGTLASLLLVAAALWLEHACRAPEPPDEQDRLRSRP